MTTWACVRTVIVGDAPLTAMAVAPALGICGALFSNKASFNQTGPRDFGIFAAVPPDDKFRLLKAFQQRGHLAGLCGDGANDASALRQAQMGSRLDAIDVEESAAGMILTQPGPGGITSMRSPLFNRLNLA